MTSMGLGAGMALDNRLLAVASCLCMIPLRYLDKSNRSYAQSAERVSAHLCAWTKTNADLRTFSPSQGIGMGLGRTRCEVKRSLLVLLPFASGCTTSDAFPYIAVAGVVAVVVRVLLRVWSDDAQASVDLRRLGLEKAADGCAARIPRPLRSWLLRRAALLATTLLCLLGGCSDGLVSAPAPQLVGGCTEAAYHIHLDRGLRCGVGQRVELSRGDIAVCRCPAPDAGASR